MIGYVTIGSNDLERSAAFYDGLLSLFGAQRFMENDRLVAWSAGEGTPGIGICKPFDGKAATAGNGMMVSLAASDPEQVKAVYDRAIELGGSDEGEPGQRMPTFFGAYFRDPDGNKLCAFCMTPEDASAD